MNRRTLLASVGTALPVALAGCLDGNGLAPWGDGGPDRDPEAGAREPLDVRVYNYRSESVAVDVAVDADDESVHSGIVELPAPETVSADRVVATVPEGTREARIAAAAPLDDEERSATRTFDLPTPDPIEGFEIRVDDRGVSLGTLGYDAPA